METVTLHVCPFTWLHGPHPCHVVRKALDEAGIPYEMVKHKRMQRRRPELKDATGQLKLPAIQLADGRTYQAESKDMAARIDAGKLFEA